MVHIGRLDRREFLTLSAQATAAALLQESLQAFQSAEPSLVSLKVTGDARDGYGVTICFRNQPVARHHQDAEISAIFQNSERSLEDRVDDWKASHWAGHRTSVRLTGEMHLPKLRTTVSVEVAYDVLSSQVVRKAIRLRQADSYMLFFQLMNRLEPVTEPLKVWSFDQADCRGGSLRELFPAAGFRTQNGVTVGLLTDAGFRNHWSRIIRRDGTPLKPAPTRIPDLNLYAVSPPADGHGNKTFIQQTFGEVAVQQADSVVPIDLPSISSWTKNGEIEVEQLDGAFRITQGLGNGFLSVPFPAKPGEVFSVEFRYRSAQPIMVRVFDANDKLQLDDITLYNDTVPASPREVTRFQQSFVGASLHGTSAALVLSFADSAEGGAALSTAELEEFKLYRIATRCEPYHRLEMGRAETKTVFLFTSDAVPDSVRGYRLASQNYLARGLGFMGGETENVVYADTMMLCWNALEDETRPMLAPSIWYSAAGEMYLRDSFYALNGIHNRELNEKVFDVWADNQGRDGAINTLIEPNIANVERKSNDSTPLWLIWALVNRRRFGSKLPMEKITRAAEYCLATYDPKREGICTARFVIGQLDMIDYPQGTRILCENQGMLAVLLRAIRDLEIPRLSHSISDSYLAKAEGEYRTYYSVARGFMLPARNIDDAIGFAEIFPEFLSLWLFNKPMLADQMVVSHLEHIPILLPRQDCPYPEEGGTARPIYIGLPKGQQWSYFTEEWHPMISNALARAYRGKAADGTYYNGGSWMRLEICGYVTGKLHGWTRADRAIANRLWAEVHAFDDYPTSQEYLSTNPANPFSGYHRVFAWNSFVLAAMELANMRNPRMDPDYPGQQRQGQSWRNWSDMSHRFG